MKVRDLRDDGPGGGGKEDVALIGAADTAHVGHAETLDPTLNVVVAKAVIFRVRAELHHAEGANGAGKEIGAVIRIAASADQWIHTACRP